MKKRFLSLFLFLLTTMAAGATTYLHIGGVNYELGSDDKTIQGESGKAFSAGTITWDGHGRLTMKDVKIDVETNVNSFFLETTDDSYLNILVEGNNRITNKVNSAIVIDASLGFYSTGTLQLSSTGKHAIQMRRTMTLNILGPSIYIYGPGGIYGTEDKTCRIDVRNGSRLVFMANSQRAAAFQNISSKSVFRTTSGIKKPHGAYFSSSGHLRDTNDNIVTGEEVDIEDVEYYGFRIDGVFVTEANYDQFGEWWKYGSYAVIKGVTFNPQSRTLNLSNATITMRSGSSPVIETADETTINCSGTNRFVYEANAKDVIGLMLNANTTLEGGGTLDMTNGSDYNYGAVCISSSKGNTCLYNYINLKTPRVYSDKSGAAYMSCRDDWDYPTKTGTLTATGHPTGTFYKVLMGTGRWSYQNSAGSYGSYHDFNLKMPFKTYAKKAAVYQYNDGETCGVVDASKNYVTGLVEFEGNQTLYPVEIAGYAVTSSNKDNIANRYVYHINSDSRLSYEPGNSQLVVKDVVINAPDASSPGIRHTDKSLLTISYIGGKNLDQLGRYESGSNVIDCAADAPAIVSSGDVTISQADGGKYFWVTEKQDSEQSGWINVSGTLTFDKVDAVSVSSIQAGYVDILHSHLVVRNHLGADGHQAGRMVDTDIDTNISDPAYYGQYYSATNRTAEEKFRSKGKVWFVKTDNTELYNVWVAGTQVTSNNCERIINLFNFNDNGRMTYDPSSRSLTLYNVNMYNHWIDVNPTFEFKGRIVEEYNLVFRGLNYISAFATDNIVIDRACLNIKSDTPWTATDVYALHITSTGAGKGGVLLRNNGYLRFLGLDQKATGSAKCTLPWIKGDGTHTTFELSGLPLKIKGKAPDNGPAIDVESFYELGVSSEVVDEEGNLLSISSDQNTVVDASGRPATGPFEFVKKGTTVIQPTSITLDKTTMRLNGIGMRSPLEATVKPDDATDKSVTWVSDDPEVASVDQEGMVKAVDNGTTTIRATTSNGLEATCQVTVELTGATGLTLSPEEITIEAGDFDTEFEVKAFFDNYMDITDTRVEWTLEGNSDLVEIVRSYKDYLREDYYEGWYMVCVLKLKPSATGAAPEGTCKLVGTNNGKSASCTINVHKTVLAQRVVMQDERGNDIKEVLFTDVSQLKQVSAKVYPENAENVKFQILGNTSATGINKVAQMNPRYGGAANEFSISSIGEGTTRLGVRVVHDSQELCWTYVDVTVKKPVPVQYISINIPDNDNKIMGIGGTLQLEAEVYPANADDQEITWSSSDKSIATVDATGLVKGVSYGKCNITAKAGGKESAEQIVVVDPSDYVIVPATAITLSRSEVTVTPTSSSFVLEAYLSPSDANEYIEWKMYDSEGNETGNCSVSDYSPRGTRTCTVSHPGMSGVYTVVAHPEGNESLRAECKVTVRDELIFYVKNADGITICYRETNIDDPDNMQCEVFGSESDPAVPEGWSGKLVIPSQVTYGGNTYTVKHITDQAFKRCCYLTEVVVSEGIETIGAEAFSFDETLWAMPEMYFSANLQTVTLPASLKGLGEKCFSGQTALTTVYMNCEEQPGGVWWYENFVGDPMIIGFQPFDNINPQATLYIPDGTLSTYYGEDIDKPWKQWFSHIEEMGTHDCYLYFTEANAEGVDISYLCTNSASKKCVVQGKSEWSQVQPAVETDPDVRNATEITVPEKVRGGAFTVVGIGVNAFIRVEGVETIRLPKTIETIGQEAFRDCSSLNDLYVKTDVPPTFVDNDGILWDEDAYAIFDVIGQNAVLHVPFGTARYWRYDPWTMWFSGGIVEEDTYFADETADGEQVSYRITDTREMTCEVKGEDGTALSGTATEVVIPEVVDDYVVTGIAAEAFESQHQLTAVTLPASLEYIGYAAFNQCTSLRDVYMLSETAPTLLGKDGNPTDGDNDAFSGLPTALARALGNNTLATEGATLHVPYGCLGEYDKYPWNSWFTSIKDDATKQVVHGDVNGDKTVDVADIASVISVMAGSADYADADVNGDGTVDVADIATIITIMAENARRQREIEE